jgi:hypothetical protein
MDKLENPEIDIMKSANNYPLPILHVNPQQTQLKHVQSNTRFTHYNKFKTLTFHKVHNEEMIYKFDPKKYHMISDLVINFQNMKVPNFEIHFMVNSKSRIKINNDIYDIFARDKNDNYRINLSELLFRVPVPFPIISKDEDYSISIKLNSYFNESHFTIEHESYILTSDEYKRFYHCSYEFCVFTYTEEDFEWTNKEHQQLIRNIPICEMAIKINKRVNIQDVTINLEHIPLIPKHIHKRNKIHNALIHHKYGTYYDKYDIVYEDHVYWNSCSDYINSNAWYLPWNWKMLMNKNDDEIYKVKMILRHPNIIQVNGGNCCFSARSRMRFSMNPLKDKSLLDKDPLTKLSETQYVEGYWFNKDDYHSDSKISLYGFNSEIDIIYPWPKYLKDDGSKQQEKPDTEFIEKLKKIIPHCEKFTSYGGSPCRLSDEIVGSIEYSFTDDGIKYNFPEGYMVYLEKFNVHPSAKFKEVVEKFHDKLFNCLETNSIISINDIN